MTSKTGGYRLAVRLPGESEWLHGDRLHPTMDSVHRQLRATAPEWRRVFGEGMECEIAPVDVQEDDE